MNLFYSLNIFRRKGLLLLFFKILLITALVLTLPNSAAVREREPKRPNIIYVLADDAGYGDFGCYGQEDILTPNIDRAASEGMRFTSHYAAAPVCAPSRCGLLTGKHTGNAYIRGNYEIMPEGQLALDSEEITIAEMLNKEGYTSGVIGKWGLGGPGTEGEPNSQGFDHWFGYLCQRQAHSYYPEYLWRDGKRVPLDGKIYTHDLFTEDALEFIKTNSSDPFFLYLAYAVPHAKLQVPDTAPYDDKDWSESKKKYAAMVTRLDRDVGKIMKLVKELGIDQNTLIMITSDNGPHNEGGADPSFFDSNGPFRGMKRDLYEGGIRVPLVARWPGVIKPGTVSEHVSAFWDMAPTFAELAGSDPPDDTDGISMVPELTGRPDQQEKHPWLYWEFHEQGGKQAVRKGDWKGIRLNVRIDPDSPVELYNLEEDPGEKQNLAADHPDIVSEMAGTMDEARTKSDIFPLLGKINYHFSPFNGWRFGIIYIAMAAALSLLGLARKENRVDIDRIFRRRGNIRKSIALVPGLVQGGMLALSAFLPLWFGTWRFQYGMYICLAGLAGYALCRLHYLFRKPGSPVTYGLFRIAREPALVFTVLFWIGVALATTSLWLFILVAIYVLVYTLAFLQKEKDYLDAYGEEFREYAERTARFIPFIA